MLIIECVLITESEWTLSVSFGGFSNKKYAVSLYKRDMKYNYIHISFPVYMRWRVKLGSGGILVKRLHHLFIFAAFDIDCYHILLHIYELRLRLF